MSAFRTIRARRQRERDGDRRFAAFATLSVASAFFAMVLLLALPDVMRAAGPDSNLPAIWALCCIVLMVVPMCATLLWSVVRSFAK